MSADITITEAEGTWVVRAKGAIIGESARALLLSETGFPPIIYFPREDIEMVFLDRSDLRTTCPRKGEASYFDLVAKSGTVKNAVWSYETPIAGMEALAGYLAFDADSAEVEQL